MLIAALALAALLAGLAGAWSPCGLSMVETLAAGRRASIVAGSGLFAAGAAGGAVVTFGGLSAIGSAFGFAGGLAAAAALVALLVAAAGDAAGRRLVPQIRRQVPESWRRRLPLPVASGLYGVLLGLGFTTFVLSFATYGLALACLALGDPRAGLVIGLGFATGRALPVVALAWRSDAAAALAERPQVLRGLRAGAAAAMTAAAAVLALGGAPAHAAEIFSASGADPGVGSDAIVWEDGQGRGLIRRGDRVDVLPGTDPAAGPGLVAWLDGAGAATIADTATLTPRGAVQVGGADALAVSDRYLAWRVRDGDGTTRIRALDLLDPAAAPVVVASASTASAALGAPALDGATMVFHVAGTVSSRIVEVDLATGARRDLRRGRRALLLNPSILGDSLLYVRSTASRQQLVLGTRGDAEGDRVLYGTTPTARRDSGEEAGHGPHRQGYPKGRRPPTPQRPRPGLTRTLWTTALGPADAFVTVLRARRGKAPAAKIIRTAR